MRRRKTFKDYTVQDFILDEQFQDWVLHPDVDNNDFWHNWLQANPDKHKTLEEAAIILRNLDFNVMRPPSGKAEASMAEAWQKIKMQEVRLPKKNGILRQVPYLWRVAAICVMLLGLTLLLVQLLRPGEQPVQVVTNFGELDTVYLPDRSMVVLNANSAISYNKSWDKNKPREVWLKGEALFHVRHLDKDGVIAAGERFLVHTGPATVEVLGTSFDVRQRRSKIEIALLSGLVKVHFDISGKSDIQLKPGDVVVMDTLLANVNKIRANTNDYAGWTQKRLLLNNPTLQEIVNYLEDIYGKKIVLSDRSLANRTIQGPIMLDSLDDALFIISTVLNVKIIEQNNILIIKSP